MLSHIKECKRLKNVIHQIDRNEWLLLSAFQQSLRQYEHSFLKNGLKNSLPFERSACFYVTIAGNFECFQYFNFYTKFLKSANSFLKTGVRFLGKVLRLKTQHFYTKLLCQKPMLGQIEWGAQNGLITKKVV